MNLCLFCKKIDLYMDHLGSYLLPLFCYQKKKKNQDSTPRPLWSQCKIPVNYLEGKQSRDLWSFIYIYIGIAFH